MSTRNKDGHEKGLTDIINDLLSNQRREVQYVKQLEEEIIALRKTVEEQTNQIKTITGQNNANNSQPMETRRDSVFMAANGHSDGSVMSSNTDDRRVKDDY